MGRRRSSVSRRLRAVVVLALVALALAGCQSAAPMQAVPSPQAAAAPTEQAALPTAPPTAAPAAPTATAALPTLVPSPLPTTAPALRAVVEPALPQGLLPPTATPAFPEQALSPDNLAALRQLRTIGYGSINDASAAPAARLLAVATSAGLALFELPSFTLLRFTPGEARSVLLSPDGQRMLVDGQLLRTADGERLANLSSGARFSFDSRLIASSSGNATAILQSSDGKPLRTFLGAQATFSPDNSLVAVTTKADIRIMRVSDGAVGRILATPTADIKDLAFSADGQQLRAVFASDREGKSVELWEWRVLDGQPIRTLPIAIDNRYGTVSGEVILSPLGEQVAVLSGFVEGGRGFTLYSTDDGRKVDLPVRRQDQPSNLTFSADGSVAVYWDIQIYPRDDALHLLALPDLSAKELTMPVLSGLAFNPNGQTLAGVTWFGVSTWRVIDGAPQQALVVDLQLPFSSGQIRYGVDGRTLTLAGDSLIVYGDFGSQLTTWDAQSGAVTQRWEKYLAQLFAISPGGRLCATFTTFDNEGPRQALYLLDLTRGITVALELAAPISAAAFTPDGALLAVGDEAGTVRLLRADDASPAGELALGGEVLSLSFSPDGTLLASQRKDGLVQVWRVGEREPLAAMAAPPGDTLLISADNQLLISGGSKGVTFYRLETGQLLHKLDVAADDLAIGPHGRLLAILHAGQAQLWGIPLGGT